MTYYNTRKNIDVITAIKLEFSSTTKTHNQTLGKSPQQNIEALQKGVHKKNTAATHLLDTTI